LLKGFLPEGAWRKASDNFCWMVKLKTEGSGQSSGKLSKAENDWLAGHIVSLSRCLASIFD
jgi:hypothetical protein